MRRAALTLALSILLSPAQARELASRDTRLTVRAEYRQDAIDYDGNEKRFIRDSATVSFGKSSANFTHVHIGDKKENRFTWYINMSGITPYFNCLLGNFYLNFGAGLVAGKKRATVPDPFSRGPVVSAGVPFSPCAAGSPLYAFRGFAAGPACEIGPLSVSLTGFYSFRTRYVRTDINLLDVTGSSFNSLLARTKKDYRYSEPAEIGDSGCLFMVHIGGRLTLQSYFIHTAAARSGARRLLWDYGDLGTPEGVKASYSYGFFVRYRDNAIEMFIELGFPTIIISTAAGGGRKSSGFGLIYGLKFMHRGCTLSFTGKSCDRQFYAPYAAGSSRAETSWKADIVLRPIERLTLGVACFSEKKASAAGYERYRPSSIREDAFIRYRVPGKGSFSAAIGHLEEDRQRGVQRSLRLKSSAAIFIMKSIRLSARGSFLKKGRSRHSGSIGAGLSLCMLHFFRVDLRYSRYYIARGNPLYASRATYRNSITRMTGINSTSDIAACRVSARWRGSRVSLAYEHRFSGRRSIDSRIEASATMILE